MPRIHAIENNETTRAAAAAATAPNSPSSQRKAKEQAKSDTARVSRTAPSTPSHRRGGGGSERAKYSGGCPWQSPSRRRSLTASPRRHGHGQAAGEAGQRSSPTRTAAFAAAATALAPSVVSSIRRKCESERVLPPDYALLAATPPHRHVGRGGSFSAAESPDSLGKLSMSQPFRTFNNCPEAPLGRPNAMYSNGDLCSAGPPLGDKSSLAVPGWRFDPAANTPKYYAALALGSRGIASSGRSASFGDGAAGDGGTHRRSYCDALRAELGVGGAGGVGHGGLARTHASRNMGMGTRSRGRAGLAGDQLLAKDDMGLWGKNACSVCGGLHFVSSVSSPFLATSAAASRGTPAPSPSHHNHLYDYLTPRHSQHSRGSGGTLGADSETSINLLRHLRLPEFPDGYASETDIKYSAAAIKRLEKEMQSCPLCISQAALASRNGSRVSQNIYLDAHGQTHNLSQSSSARCSRRDLALKAGSLRSAAGSPSPSGQMFPGSRLYDDQHHQHGQGRVGNTPIRTVGWAIPNNPRRVVNYEDLHSNCWVGT